MGRVVQSLLPYSKYTCKCYFSIIYIPIVWFETIFFSHSQFTEEYNSLQQCSDTTIITHVMSSNGLPTVMGHFAHTLTGYDLHSNYEENVKEHIEKLK